MYDTGGKVELVLWSEGPREYYMIKSTEEWNDENVYGALEVSPRLSGIDVS